MHKLHNNYLSHYSPNYLFHFTTLVGAGTSATTHSSFIATTTTCNKMNLTTPDLFPTMHNVYTGLYDTVPAVDGKSACFVY